MKQFKIRASACGSIMAGQIGLSDKNHDKMRALITRDIDGKKPLTENMQVEMADLIFRHANPTLPAGAKSYCEQWLKEQIYERRKRVETKYMDKGLIVEDHSIDMIAELLGFGMLVKNEKKFSDAFMTGEPDVLPKDVVIDAKNPWDCFTFPLFAKEIPDTDYEWQGQVYMHLTKRKKFILAYTLLDTPGNIIEREAKSYSYRAGYGELEQEMYDDFEKYMTYKKIKNQFKIKTFEVEYSLDKIKEIRVRVKMCREYIDTLLIDLGLDPINKSKSKSNARK